MKGFFKKIFIISQKYFSFSKKENYLELQVVVGFNLGGHSFISRMEGNSNLTCWLKLLK